MALKEVSCLPDADKHVVAEAGLLSSEYIASI